MPVSVTEGLTVTDKGSREAPSLMFDGILNVSLPEVSITRVTKENLEFPLPPNSLDSRQTQNNKMKFWTDPTILLP